MSQLHQEALRRQNVVDKRYVNDLGWSLQKPDGSSHSKRNSSIGLRSNHSAGPPSHLLYSGLNARSSSGTRSREVVITDPYLDAITKETRARTQNRFSSTDYMMQW